MPRCIDYTRGNATDWDEVTLPEPVYGEREITEAEYRALAESRTVVDGFWPQFSTHGGPSPTDRAAAMDTAHAWLSDNATGPWSWHESWSNHGHAIDTHVYVEREPDQRAFLAAHGDVFRFVAPTPHELRKTALLRGVVAPYTARESFFVWCEAHAGFAMVPDGTDTPVCRISFDIPAMEDRFARAFGGSFAVQADGQGATHVGRQDATGDGVPLVVWLDRNSGVGSQSGRPTAEGYAWRLAVRYPEVAASLERDWGDRFKPVEGEPGLYATLDYPYPPERPLPDDFLAYLAGEAETYDAPYLPDGIPPPGSGMPGSGPRR